jgi:hypothetical protein
MRGIFEAGVAHVQGTVDGEAAGGKPTKRAYGGSSELPLLEPPARPICYMPLQLCNTI